MPKLITGYLEIDENTRVQIEIDPDVGILKMSQKQGVLFRVKLINRLFGAILDKEFFWILLRKAGRAMGEDYAIDFLLTRKPGSTEEQLPDELARLGKEFKGLEGEAEKDSMNPTSLTEERQAMMRDYAKRLTQLEAEIRILLSSWLRSRTTQQIRNFWQWMHDEDIIAGWGKAQLTEFDYHACRAEIQVTTSFIARLYYYWDQQGKAGSRICSLLEGYFRGEAEVLFGRDDLVCTEKKCRLEGHDKCVFVVEPERLLA